MHFAIFYTWARARGRWDYVGFGQGEERCKGRESLREAGAEGPFSSWERKDVAGRRQGTLRRIKGGDLFPHHVLKLIRPQLSFRIAVQPVLRPRARTERGRARVEVVSCLGGERGQREVSRERKGGEERG